MKKDKNKAGVEQAPDESDPKQSFEELLVRLETIAARLEEDDVRLEEALQLFEEGVRLSKVGTQRLDAAEQRIEMLMKDGSTKPFLPPDEDT